MEFTRHIRELIDLALEEDIGGGDITTIATIAEHSNSQAVVIAKEDLIVCGIGVFKEVFKRIDEEVQFLEYRKDGERLKKGEVVMRLKGRTRSLLTGERTALNFLMHLSGIATLVSECAQKVKPSGVRITDTRKTMPGFRALEKYAVRVGGGHNHRLSLSDGILIKDNHITAAGSIRDAVAQARDFAPHTSKIEVEVKNEAELLEALEAGADILLLDNMAPDEIIRMVKIVGGRALTEASGGINPNNILAYAQAGPHGLDFISLGYLTHSARSVDMSMKIESL